MSQERGLSLLHHQVFLSHLRDHKRRVYPIGRNALFSGHFEMALNSSLVKDFGDPIRPWANLTDEN